LGADADRLGRRHAAVGTVGEKNGSAPMMRSAARPVIGSSAMALRSAL
jgi:hypothetical protein